MKAMILSLKQLEKRLKNNLSLKRTGRSEAFFNFIFFGASGHLCLFPNGCSRHA
jgi:hypothetical protein